MTRTHSALLLAAALLGGSALPPAGAAEQPLYSIVEIGYAGWADDLVYTSSTTCTRIAQSYGTAGLCRFDVQTNGCDWGLPDVNDLLEQYTGTAFEDDTCWSEASVTVPYYASSGQYCPTPASTGTGTLSLSIPSHDIALTGAVTAVADLGQYYWQVQGQLVGSDGSAATVYRGEMRELRCYPASVFEGAHAGVYFRAGAVVAAPGPVSASCAGPATLSLGDHVGLPLQGPYWYSRDVPFNVHVDCTTGSQDDLDFAGVFRDYTCHAPTSSATPPGEFLGNGDGSIGGQRFLMESNRGVTYLRPYLELDPERRVAGAGYFDLTSCAPGSAQSFAGYLAVSWSAS